MTQISKKRKENSTETDQTGTLEKSDFEEKIRGRLYSNFRRSTDQRLDVRCLKKISTKSGLVLGWCCCHSLIARLTGVTIRPRPRGKWVVDQCNNSSCICTNMDGPNFVSLKQQWIQWRRFYRPPLFKIASSVTRNSRARNWHRNEKKRQKRLSSISLLSAKRGPRRAPSQSGV